MIDLDSGIFGHSIKTVVILLSAVHIASLFAGCGGSQSGPTPDQSENNHYTVSTISQAGGQIEPTSQIVQENGTASFSLTADTGYTINSVTGCDGTLSGNSYTTGPITSDCTVNVSFTTGAPGNYTITTHVGVGGAISPTTAEVASGSSTTFTVTVNTNYSISSVSGCGGTLANNTYTTGPVSADCAVIVLFQDNSPVEAKSFLQAIADGDEAPVVVNGEEWTFRTPPPPVDHRTVRAGHPRLILTPDNLPGIKQKLADPLYASLMAKITLRAEGGSMLENAFLYKILGETSRGELAKQALLNYSGDYGSDIIFGYDRMAAKLGPVLVFDWIWELLNDTEKAQIFANVKDNFKYDHKTANPVHQYGGGLGTYPWYWNDVYSRLPEIYLPALAFAIAGEGIDDPWAEEVISWAYDEDETRVLGPYGPKRGSGFLDVLMSVSLDSGGISPVGVGYTNFWVEVIQVLAFWETATGQSMWSRVPMLTKNPQAILTSREGIDPRTHMRAAIEYMTGVTGGDTAALAKYVVEYYGPSTYHEVFRAILGDMRVTAKTPTELNLPTAGYVRGDHTFYSKESWADDAVSLYVRSPYINATRYVGNEGVFALYKGGTPISPRARIAKTQPDAGVLSGVWIYDPNATDSFGNPHIESTQNKGTFWSPDRSFDAWTTVSQNQYFDGGPDAIEVTADYRAISMEYGDRYSNFNVGRAQRTIIHIPEPTRNFIVIYDYIDGITDLKSAWSMRLMETPGINGSAFSIPGTFNATVVSPPGHTLEWLGGFNKEFVSPSPEQLWYTNKTDGSVPGYSVDRPEYIANFGKGNLYIQPPGQRDSSTGPYAALTEYLVVIEVGSSVPVSVSRISDREVSFGQWQVRFSPDGSYVVTKL